MPNYTEDREAIKVWLKERLGAIDGEIDEEELLQTEEKKEEYM